MTRDRPPGFVAVKTDGTVSKRYQMERQYHDRYVGFRAALAES
jgi:hypothetical protein